MAADFTFDPASAPAFDALVPLYTSLTSKKVTTVSLGAVDRASAEAWLRAQHNRYRDAVGKRSSLLYNMDIVDRITMQDLTDP